ncbi:MAG: nucleotidyltransferase domain-containing protein [bacterium]
MPRTAIPLPLDLLADFCRRHGIARLEVFGSILRDDFGPESDIDILFTLAPGAPELSSHWLRFDIHDELEAILGRRVDFIRRSTIEASRNPERKAVILESAEVLVDLARAA